METTPQADPTQTALTPQSEQQPVDFGAPYRSTEDANNEFLGGITEVKTDIAPLVPVYGGQSDKSNEVGKKIYENSDYDAGTAIAGSFAKSLQLVDGMTPEDAQETERLFRSTGQNANLDKASIANLQGKYNLKRIYDTVTATDERGNPKHPLTLQYLNDPAKLAQLLNHAPMITEYERRLAQANENWLQQAGRAAISSVTALPADIEKIGYIGNLRPKASVDESVKNALGSQFSREFAPVKAEAPVFSVDKAGFNFNFDSLSLNTVGFLSQIYALGGLGKAASWVGRGAQEAEALKASQAATSAVWDASATQAEAIAKGLPIAADVEKAAKAGMAAEQSSKAIATYFGAEGAAHAYEKDAGTGKNWFSTLLNAAMQGTAGAMLGGGTAARMVEGTAGRAAAESIQGVAWNILKDANRGGVEMAMLTQYNNFADWITQAKPSFDGVHPGEIALQFLNDYTSNALASGLGASLHEVRSYTANLEAAKATAEIGGKFADIKNKDLAIGTILQFEKQNGIKDDATVSAAEVLKTYGQQPARLEEFERDNGLDKGEVAQKAKDGKDITISKAKSAVGHNELFSDLVNRSVLKLDGVDGEGMKRLVDEAKVKAEQLQNRLTNLKQMVANKGKGSIELPEGLQAIRTTLMKGKDEGGAGLNAEKANVQMAILASSVERLAADRGQTTEQWLKENPIELKVGKQRELKAGENPKFYQNKDDNFLSKITGKKPRGAFYYDGDKGIIHLFQGGDASTFLHESSHMIFTKMEQYVTGKIASEAMVKDYQTLKEWLGDKAFETNGALKMDGHERLARAFEAYLMDGKAPRRDLVRPFARMSQWLSDVYSNVKTLLGEDKISPEVRAVFNRRLASDEQVKQAEDFYALRENSARSFGLSPKVVNAVEDAKQTANAETRTRQASKLMAAYTKAIGGDKAVRAEIEKRVDEDPMQKAIELAKEQGGLNADLFEAEFGADAAKLLGDKHKGLITEKGELTLSEIAGDDVDAFFSQLVNAPTRAEAIELATKDWQQQTEKDLLQGQQQKNSLTQADESVVQSDATFKYITAEAQALADEIERTTGRQMAAIDREVLKTNAENEIANRTASEAGNAKPYLQEVKRLADEIKKTVKKIKPEASKFMDAKGNKDLMAKVYDLRRKQIENLTLAREAQNAAAKVARIEKRYQPSQVDSRLEKMAFMERGLYDLVLKNYGERADKPIDPAFSEEAGSDAASIAKWLFDYAPDLSATLPKNIFDQQTTDGLMSLKYKDLLRADDALQAIAASGREYMGVKEAALKKSTREVAEGVATRLQLLSDVNINDTTNPLNGIRQAWGRAGAEMMMMLQRAQILDGDLSGKGQFSQLVEQAINKYALATNMKMDKLHEINKSFKMMATAKQRIEKEHGGKYFDVDGVKMDDRYTRFGDKGGKLSFERCRAIILHTGTSDNYAKIKEGYGLTDEMVQKVASLFTADELNAIQRDREVMQSLWEPMADVYRRKHDKSPVGLQAASMTFTSRDGSKVTLKGGYAPIVYDRRAIAKAGAKAINEAELNQDIDKDASAALFYTKSIGEGSFQQRTKTTGWKPVSLDYDGVIQRHIDWATRYIHQQELLDYLSKVVMNPDLKTSVSQKMGVEHYSALKNWVADMANPGRRMIKEDSIVRAAESFSKGSAMMIRPDNLVSWNLSATNAITEIGNGDFGKGLSALRQIFPDLRGAEDMLKIGGAYNETQKVGIIETIKGLSPLMNARWSEAQMRLEKGKQALLGDNAKGNLLTKYMEHAGNLSVEGTDVATTYYLWWGAYKIRLGEMAKEGKLSYEQQLEASARYADGIIEKIQPLSNIANASEFMKRQDGYLRSLPLFKTFLSLSAGRIHTNLMGATRGISSWQRYISHVTLDIIAEPMMQVGWRALVYGGSSVGIWNYLLAPISQVASSTGSAGIVLGKLLEEMTGSSKTSSKTGGVDAKDVMARVFTPGYIQKPVNIALNDYNMLIRHLQGRKVDDARTARGIADIIQLGAFAATGQNIPIGNAARLVEGVADKINGGDQ